MEGISEKNYWDSKPIWCQPFTIILFGILCFVFCWILFNKIIFMIILSLIIIPWWILFLFIAPTIYKNNTNNNLQEN